MKGNRYSLGKYTVLHDATHDFPAAIFHLRLSDKKVSYKSLSVSSK